MKSRATRAPGLVLLLCGVLTAPAAAAAVAASTAAATGLPAPKAPYWLKPYSTSPIEESWNAALTVKDLDADLPKVVQAVSDEGGVLTQDLKSFVSSKADHTQQLMLTLPRARTKALFKKWARIGDLHDPEKRATDTRIPADEIKVKIDRLMKERVERAKDLDALPIAREIEDEILERLLLVEDVARTEGGAAHIDVLVRQR
jgi:hypothetical protein